MQTQKDQLDKLLPLLDEAAVFVGGITGGYSNRFTSAEEFHKALLLSIEKLRLGDINEIETLWIYFAPTCAWDDFTHYDGLKLCNQIFELLDKINKS
jgi:hypothetical protein